MLWERMRVPSVFLQATEGNRHEMVAQNSRENPLTNFGLDHCGPPNIVFGHLIANALHRGAFERRVCKYIRRGQYF